MNKTKNRYGAVIDFDRNFIIPLSTITITSGHDFR